MERRFAEQIIRFRWLIIVATILACGLSGYGLQFLTVSSEPRDSFGPNNPQLKAFEELEETFSRFENLFLLSLRKRVTSSPLKR